MVWLCLENVSHRCPEIILDVPKSWAVAYFSKWVGQSKFYAFQKRAAFSSILNKQETIKSQNDTSHYSDEKQRGPELTTTRVMLSTRVSLVRTTPCTALPVLAWPEDTLWARFGGLSPPVDSWRVSEVTLYQSSAQNNECHVKMRQNIRACIVRPRQNITACIVRLRQNMTASLSSLAA